ncbi:hypothetical protein CRE_09096 [Caenorhabditis remanei]|uniref:Lin-15A/B-like domain-containing protein n=1 Tax=Caenorhabditis remanei TaxID=31234 RepID=E3LJ92_CAERE|nr:hypothetical protein CRE_09096 [Caenorhabditis remanei]
MEIEEQKPKDFLDKDIKQEPEDFNDETLSDSVDETYEYKSEMNQYNSYEETTEIKHSEREEDEEDDPYEALLTDNPVHRNYEQLNVVQKYFLHNHNSIPRFSIRADIDEIGPIRKRGRPRKYEIPDHDPREISVHRSSMGEAGSESQNSGETRISPVQERRPRRDRCSVCTCTRSRNKMKCVTSAEERLMLFIGSVLHGDLTVEKAKLHLYSCDRKYICRSHFINTAESICKGLGIENCDNVYSCSPELMKKVLATANEFYPIDSSRFKIMVANFANQNNYIVENGNTSSDDDSMNNLNFNQRIQRPRKPRLHSARCSICTKYEDRRKMKQLSSYKEKVILMTVWLLREVFTIQQVKGFVTGPKIHYVCNHHFIDVISRIFDILGIKTYGEIARCSSENIEKIMVTVNSIDSDMRPAQFIRAFQRFVHLNMKRKEW